MKKRIALPHIAAPPKLPRITPTPLKTPAQRDALFKLVQEALDKVQDVVVRGLAARTRAKRAKNEPNRETAATLLHRVETFQKHVQKQADEWMKSKAYAGLPGTGRLSNWPVDMTKKRLTPEASTFMRRASQVFQKIRSKTRSTTLPDENTQNAVVRGYLPSLSQIRAEKNRNTRQGVPKGRRKSAGKRFAWARGLMRRGIKAAQTLTSKARDAEKPRVARLGQALEKSLIEFQEALHWQQRLWTAAASSQNLPFWPINPLKRNTKRASVFAPTALTFLKRMERAYALLKRRVSS